MLFAAGWGAIWGSFFNVVVARVPCGESVLHPPSHCRACGYRLHWYDNVPIVSYLLLRGRCRHCGARYSVRYMLVEMLVAVLALGMHWVFVRGGAGPMGLRAAQFVVVSIFSGLLCAVALIDIATMRIPNAITYPGIPVAVALSLLMGHPQPWDGLIGAVAGYLVIRAVADGYERLTGRQGMGYGDAKLLAMIGGLMGWRALLPTLFLASLQGSLIGITALVVVRRRQQRNSAPEPAAEAQPGDPEEQEASAGALRHARIPFGPFLSLAAIELLLLRDSLPLLFPYLYQ